MNEAQTQRAIVDYLQTVLFPTHRVVAIPNGAVRTASGRASNAVAGLRRGVPDLMIVGDGKVYFIEVKASRGKLTAEQSEWANWCVMKGLIGWCCAKSIDDVRVALGAWKIKTREAANFARVQPRAQSPAHKAAIARGRAAAVNRVMR